MQSPTHLDRVRLHCFKSLLAKAEVHLVAGVGHPMAEVAPKCQPVAPEPLWVPLEAVWVRRRRGRTHGGVGAKHHYLRRRPLHRTKVVASLA